MGPQWNFYDRVLIPARAKPVSLTETTAKTCIMPMAVTQPNFILQVSNKHQKSRKIYFIVLLKIAEIFVNNILAAQEESYPFPRQLRYSVSLDNAICDAA